MYLVKRISLFAFFLVLSLNVFAQDNVLVPFKEKGLFGLANLKGKLVMPASYSSIEPIGKDYFKFVSGEGKTSYTGVLHGTKVIINNSKHQQFYLAEEGLIVASEKTYISENSNIYNLKGEKLFEENFHKSQLLRFGANKLVGEKAPFIALLVENFNQQVSLLVFDCQQQKLLEPILDKVNNFKLDRTNSSGLTMACTYTDAKGNSYHDMIYLDPKTKKLVKENYPLQNHLGSGSGGNGVVGPGERYTDDGAGAGMESDRNTLNKPKYNPSSIPEKKPAYFTRKDNGNAIDYNNNPLSLNANEIFYFANPYGNKQTAPLVYQNNNKWGLVFSDSVRTKPMYDSIIYLKGQGQNFKEVYYYMVGVKEPTSGFLKYGIINEKGENIVPMVYDKLLAGLLEIDLNDKTDSSYFEWKSPRIYANNKVLVFELSPQELLQATQNGKQGIINLKGELVMPFLYDKIWKNTFRFMRSYEVNTDFMVYQMGNKYGVFYLNRNGEINKKTLPIFDEIPIYVYKNYMGVSNLDIYNVTKSKVGTHYFVNGDGRAYGKVE